jgi:hypothetical protein
MAIAGLLIQEAQGAILDGKLVHLSEQTDHYLDNYERVVEQYPKTTKSIEVGGRILAQTVYAVIKAKTPWAAIPGAGIAVVNECKSAAISEVVGDRLDPVIEGTIHAMLPITTALDSEISEEAAARLIGFSGAATLKAVGLSNSLKAIRKYDFSTFRTHGTVFRSGPYTTPTGISKSIIKKEAQNAFENLQEKTLPPQFTADFTTAESATEQAVRNAFESAKRTAPTSEQDTTKQSSSSNPPKAEKPQASGNTPPKAEKPPQASSNKPPQAEKSSQSSEQQYDFTRQSQSSSSSRTEKPPQAEKPQSSGPQYDFTRQAHDYAQHQAYQESKADPLGLHTPRATHAEKLFSPLGENVHLGFTANNHGFMFSVHVGGPAPQGTPAQQFGFASPGRAYGQTSDKNYYEVIRLFGQCSELADHITKNREFFNARIALAKRIGAAPFPQVPDLTKCESLESPIYYYFKIIDANKAAITAYQTFLDDFQNKEAEFQTRMQEYNYKVKMYDDAQEIIKGTPQHNGIQYSAEFNNPTEQFKQEFEKFLQISPEEYCAQKGCTGINEDINKAKKIVKDLQKYIADFHNPYKQFTQVLELFLHKSPQEYCAHSCEEIQNATWYLVFVRDFTKRIHMHKVKMYDYAQAEIKEIEALAKKIQIPYHDQLKKALDLFLHKSPEEYYVQSPEDIKKALHYLADAKVSIERQIAIERHQQGVRFSLNNGAREIIKEIEALHKKVHIPYDDQLQKTLAIFLQESAEQYSTHSLHDLNKAIQYLAETKGSMEQQLREKNEKMKMHDYAQAIIKDIKGYIEKHHNPYDQLQQSLDLFLHTSPEEYCAHSREDIQKAGRYLADIQKAMLQVRVDRSDFSQFLPRNITIMAIGQISERKMSEHFLEFFRANTLSILTARTIVIEIFNGNFDESIKRQAHVVLIDLDNQIMSPPQLANSLARLIKAALHTPGDYDYLFSRLDELASGLLKAASIGQLPLLDKLTRTHFVCTAKGICGVTDANLVPGIAVTKSDIEQAHESFVGSNYPITTAQDILELIRPKGRYIGSPYICTQDEEKEICPQETPQSAQAARLTSPIACTSQGTCGIVDDSCELQICDETMIIRELHADEAKAVRIFKLLAKDHTIHKAHHPLTGLDYERIILSDKTKITLYRQSRTGEPVITITHIPSWIVNTNIELHFTAQTADPDADTRSIEALEKEFYDELTKLSDEERDAVFDLYEKL